MSTKSNASATSDYAKSGVTRESPEQRYNRTVKRLESIQNQLAAKPLGTKLKGKVCIITGVGSLKGIGRASAFAYAHEGATHLYLFDFDGTNLPELKATLTGKYPNTKVTTIQGDAADESLVAATCKRAVDEEGRLDVFFANAGVIPNTMSLDSATSEEFNRMFRINTLSCFFAVKYGSQAMKKTSAGKPQSGGSILMTASTAGIRSGAGPIDYSMSKAGVISMAQTSAYQLTGSDIRVNSISPGLIETGMTIATFDYARAKGSISKVGQLNPLGRFGIAEEVAQVALFLSCDDSSYVNGQNIAVDGGLSASHPTAPGRSF